MSVSRVAVTTGAPAAVTAFSPTLPTHATGDRMVLVVTGKYNTTSIPTINQGWTIVQSGTGGTGATGNDVGQMFWAVYAKDATSGAETAPTVTPGGTAPNSWEWICGSYRLGAGETWRDTIANGAGWVTAASDTNTASPLAGVAGAWTGVEPTAGDAILAVGAIPTDLGSALGTTTLTCTGLSGGTKSTATTQYIENALGNDTAAVWADWVDFTGTATAGLDMSFTVTGATNQSGSLVAIALRAQAADQNAAVYVSSSRSGQSDTNASSNTCPVPAGAAAGMTAYLGIEVFLDTGSGPVAPTWPSGFTQIVDRQATPSNGVQLLVAKKVLTGADSGNYVTALGATRWNMSMCVLVDKVVTTSTPDANSLKDGTGTSITGLSVTTAEPPVLIHFQANNSTATHSPPFSFTEQQEGDYITVATRTPGSSGSWSTSGASQSVSTVWAAVLLAAEGGTPSGLTPVTKTLESRFNVRAGVTDQLDTRFNVRTGIGDSLEIRFNSREAVSETIESRFNVRAEVQKTLESRFNVAGSLTPVTKTLESRFNVRAAITDTLDTRFNVWTAVTDSLDSRFNVRAAVTDTLESRYGVREAVSDVLDTRFNVRAGVADQLESRFNVRAAVTKSLATEWNVASSILSVTKTLESRFNVRAGVTDQLDTRFNVRTGIGDTLESRFHVLVGIGDTLESRFNVRAAVLDQLDTRFNVLTDVTKSLGIAWNTREAVSTSLAISWNVESDIGGMTLYKRIDNAWVPMTLRRRIDGAWV